MINVDISLDRLVSLALSKRDPRVANYLEIYAICDIRWLRPLLHLDTS